MLERKSLPPPNSYTSRLLSAALPLPTAARLGSALPCTHHGRTLILDKSFCVQRCGAYPHCWADIVQLNTLPEQLLSGALGVNGRAVVAGVLQGRPL